MPKAIEIRSPYPTECLRRGAKRLAKNSAIRLSEPAVAKRMKVLQRLVRSSGQCRLKLGDVLVELIDRFDLRPVDLARELKERANHLSEMYYVSKMFPTDVRQPHIPYSIYWASMRTVRRFPELKLKPMAVVREIASEGFTQHRHITAHFAAKARADENTRVLKASERISTDAWFNRCHEDDFRNIVKMIPNRACKMIHADPPYASYSRVPDGRYSAGSLTRTTCDNESGQAAIQLTVDLLRDWGPKLASGGVLLLWQASGPLRKQIAHAVDAYGWEVEAVVIWDKASIQPGNFQTPYSVQTEWLWVLKRLGEKLINHDNSRRGDILRFPSVHRTVDLKNREHAFEKPIELCRFLIGKHSYAGEVVVESMWMHGVDGMRGNGDEPPLGIH